ncbi:MAG: hypothetical protein JJD97_10910, partial [Gemmatimonadaceae bacterium]|nr:hypothetical protein [Gemmatimonadaceae bacterium]
MADPRAVLRAIERRLSELLSGNRAPKAAREWRRIGDVLASLLELPPAEQAARLDALAMSAVSYTHL